MASTRTVLGCPVCGLNRGPQFFGLNTETGVYDPEARPPKLVAYRHHFGGRANIRVDHLPVTMEFAIGLRDNLRAALALVEAEIEEAGGG